MALDQNDLTAMLADREQAQRVLGMWNGTSASYNEWKSRIRDVDNVYANKWDVVWPDDSMSSGLPKIANFVQLASEDRARQVAAGSPSIVKRPSKPGDTARKKAELTERILTGYWQRNRVRGLFPRWALDAQFTGVCAVKVLPDYKGYTDRSKVFPEFCRIDPRMLYPDPIFSHGPFLDNALVATTQKVREVEKKYGVKLSDMTKPNEVNKEECRVIEFYSSDTVAILAQGLRSKYASTEPKSWAWVVEPTKHKLSHCPVVIGTRPTGDSVYRGDFDGTLAMLNTLNRFTTLELDAGVARTYPLLTSFDAEEPTQWGPDAHIKLESVNGKVEYVAHPGASFSNFQLMRMMEEWSRDAAILPAARSGDPTQSIISAAGVGAVNGQGTDYVRSLQRDTLAPMLEAANELALEVDEKHGDAKKTITGERNGQAFSETYTPSEDIQGDYSNSVSYGLYGGVDPINQSVMLQQNAGSGIISMRSAREQSPLVEDPIREERQLALEQLDHAILTGINTGAAAPPGTPGAIDPFTIARLRKLLTTGDLSLDEALEQLGQQVPLAQAPLSPAQNPSGVPGIAGAQAVQQDRAFSGPPLGQLLAGGRP